MTFTLPAVISAFLLGFVVHRFIMVISRMFIVPIHESNFEIRMKSGEIQQFRIRFIGRARVESVEIKMPDGETIIAKE